MSGSDSTSRTAPTSTRTRRDPTAAGVVRPARRLHPRPRRTSTRPLVRGACSGPIPDRRRAGCSRCPGDHRRGTLGGRRSSTPSASLRRSTRQRPTGGWSSPTPPDAAWSTQGPNRIAIFSTRPEIRAALDGSQASGLRLSETLGAELLRLRRRPGGVRRRCRRGAARQLPDRRLTGVRTTSRRDHVGPTRQAPAVLPPPTAGACCDVKGSPPTARGSTVSSSRTFPRGLGPVARIGPGELAYRGLELPPSGAASAASGSTCHELTIRPRRPAPFA